MKKKLRWFLSLASHFFQKFPRKFFSVFLVFTMLAPIFLPWKNVTFSAQNTNEHFVSVFLVEESLYIPGEEGTESLTGKIARYAQDVQRSTNNTKVLILPVPADATSEEIFRVLENLYFSGQKRGEKTFFLNSIVLIGDVVLPKLTSDVGLVPSVFPYTDFKNPVFIWDSTDKNWIENPKQSMPEAEIFHGLIRGTNEQMLSFFDKNHETRIGLEEGKFSEMVNDTIYFSDFREEEKAFMIPLLEQYETRQKISEELVNHRYNKQLLSAITGNFIKNKVFSSEISDEERALFGEGATVYDNMEDLTSDFTSASEEVSDTKVKDSLENFIPDYMTAGEGFSREAISRIIGTGRWDSSSSYDTAELITGLDTFVAHEVKKMNDASFDQMQSIVEKMDSGVRLVDRYQEVMGYGSFTSASGRAGFQDVNKRNGLDMSEISDARKCSLYRGFDGYEDQYDPEKYFGDETKILLPDPLPGVKSQQVEFSLLNDPMSLTEIEGKKIKLFCEESGGCCALNINNRAACNVDKAIHDLFSWEGDKISHESEERTSALECQQFAFAGEIGVTHLIGGGYLGNYTGKDFIWGSLPEGAVRTIPSLITHKEPSFAEEQSLLNASKDILAADIPSNRIHYIDILLGDDGIKNRVKHTAENFFRYESPTPTIVEAAFPAQTQYELSRLMFENQMKLVGGNSVYNRKIQPGESAGLAQQSAALKFQRVVRFIDGQMQVGHAFPVADDFGKVGHNYEVETKENFPEEGILYMLWKFVIQMRTDDGPLNISSALLEPYNPHIPFELFDLYNFFQKEAESFFPFVWEIRAKNKLDTVISPEAYAGLKASRNNFVDVSQYYLHDLASDGFATLNPDLDKYLPEVDSEYTKGFEKKYWIWEPLTLNHAPYPMEGNVQESLPEMHGKYFYEVFEVLAVQDDPLFSGIPAGGRSFTNIRKNSENISSLYGEITGINVNPKEKSKFHVVLPTAEAEGIAEEGETKTFSGSPHNSITGAFTCQDAGPFDGPYPKIYEDEFYHQNIVKKDGCEVDQYFETYSLEGMELPEFDQYASLYTQEDKQNIADIQRNDFLFKWRNATSDAKHKLVMSAYLDKNDTALFEEESPEKKGYTYMHLNIKGDNNLRWEEIPHDTEGLIPEVASEEEEENTENSEEEEQEEEERGEEDACGYAPEDTVSLVEWPSAMSCWMKELENIGKTTLQCGKKTHHSNNNSPENSPSPTEETDSITVAEYKTYIPYSAGMSSADKNSLYKKISGEIQSNGTNFPVDVPKTIRAKFWYEGTQISPLGQRIPVSITLSGAEFSGNITDLDSEKEGLQQTTLTGKLDFQIIPTGSGPVSVTISYEYESLTGVLSKDFSIIQGAAITVSENIDVRETKGDSTIYSLSTSVGEVDYQGPLYVNIQESDRVRISQSRVEPGENFLVGVKGSEPIEVRVSGDGFETGTILLAPEGWEAEMEAKAVDKEAEAEAYFQELIEKKEKESPVALTFERKDLEEFSLNTFYASLTGLKRYNNEGEQHIANMLLHHSDMLNVITTHIVPPVIAKPVATLYKKGGMNILDDSYEPELSSLEPIQFSFMGADGVTPFAQLQYENAEISVENFSQASGLTTTKTAEKISFFYGNNLIADVYASGSIIVHSKSFQIQRDTDFSEETLTFLLAKGKSTLAKIIFKNGTWKNITEEVDPDRELNEDQQKIWDARDHSVRNDFTGTNLQVFDMQSKQTIPLFKRLQSNFSRNSAGYGFENREKFVLLFADGKSVGEATQASSEIFLVNFGDPFFRIPVPESNDSGFTQTVGTEIFSRQEGDIASSFTLDVDGDGSPDIATVLTSGEVIFSTRYADSFKNWGVGTKIDPEYTFLSGYDGNGDGYDGIIYTNKKGKIFFWENTGGIFTLHTQPENFPDINLMSGALQDANADGYPDLGVVDKKGQAMILYGDASRNFSLTNSQNINSVNFTLPENLSNNLIISFKGITDLPNAEEFLFPLPYFSTQKNILKTELEGQKSAKERQEGLGEHAVPVGGTPFQEDIDTMAEGTIAQTESVFLPTEKYFTLLSTFQNSFSTISKTARVIGEDPENIHLGSRLEFTVRVTSSDTDTITFTLGDVYSQMLSLDRSTVQCVGCGENYTAPSYPHIAQAIVFEDITLAPEESALITYQAEITTLPGLDLSFVHLNEDSILDVLLTQDSGKNTERYASTPEGEYALFEPEEEEHELPEQLQDNTVDENHNGVADKNEVDENEDGIPDFANKIIDERIADKNDNGIPDKQEDGETIAEIGEALDTAIDALASCGGGGCLSLPINYASLVPGQMNLGMLKDMKVGIPSGPQPYVMTVFNYSNTGSWCVFNNCKQIVPGGIITIPYDVGFAKSTFRFYLSPTLTGGLGIEMCTGLGGTTVAPTGKCFIQAVSPDFLGDFCKDITGDLMESFVSKVGNSSSIFQVSSGEANPGTGGARVTFDLSSIDTSIPTAKNTRLKSGPNYFADWANRQIEEMKGMFTTLPKITVYYPDLSQSMKISSWMDTNTANDTLENFEKNITKWDHFSSPDSPAELTINTNINANNAEGTLKKVTNAAKESIEDGYDLLQPADTFLKNAKDKAKDIQDLYRIIETVPLIRLERKRVILYVPSLTRRELIEKIAQAEEWVVDAEMELDKSSSEIGEWGIEGKKRFADAKNQGKTAVKDMKKLIKSLYFFLNQFPELMEQFDGELSDYLYQVMCYVNAVVEITDAWSRRNSIRVEKWEEFIATLPAVFEAFAALPKVFNSYKSSCTTCHAGNYDSGTFETMIIGNLLPEPPIVKFPRLPDLTLDISQINAAIVVQIPEIEFRERPIHLPDVFPPLRLPDLSPAGITDFKLPIPDIPVLPIIEFPEFTPLPALELPQLPNIPPAPELPDFITDFGTVLKVIEKGLYLYCLIVRKSIFVHPEASSMSVIETLTARPLKPLQIDFLAKKLPNISFPTLSEIEIVVETNLEKDFSVFVDETKSFAKKINAKTLDFMDTDKYINEGWGEALDFSDTEIVDNFIDGIDDGIKDVNNDLQQNVNEINTQTQEFEESSQEKVDDRLSSQDDFEMKLWKRIVHRNKSDLAHKWDYTSEKFVDVSVVRKSLGLPEYRPKNRLKNYAPYAGVQKKILAFQEENTRQHQNFIDSGREIIALLDHSSDLSEGKIYAQNTPKYQVSSYKDNQIIASPENIVDPDTIFDSIDAYNGESNINTPSGIFIKGRDEGVYKMVKYGTEEDFINSFFFLSQENGKEDIVYSTPFSVFVKEQVPAERELETTENSRPKNPYTGPFEVGEFSAFLPIFQGPKNLEVTGEGRNLSLTVFPESKELVSGVVYIQDQSVFAEQRGYGSNPEDTIETRKYIFRLEKAMYNQVLLRYPEISPDTFVAPPENFSLQPGVPLHLSDHSEIMISRFDSMNTEIFVDSEQTYSVSAQWITKDGSLSTLSDHILVSNLPSDDHSMPIILDDFEKVAYLYRSNTIALSRVLDLEGSDVSIAWDTNRDGIYETHGESIQTPIYREPFQESIPIQISDKAGNTADAQVIISYQAPPVYLDPEISSEKISGYVSPRYGNVPVTLLRERDGVTKKIITDSMRTPPENFEYALTNSNGEFGIENFDLSPNVWIRDKQGKVVGEVIAKTGKLVSRDEAYTVDIIPSNDDMQMRQVLLNPEKIIVGNVLIETFSENSVQQVNSSVPMNQAEEISGTYVRDANDTDNFVSSLLPLVAPENPGGQVVFDRETKESLVFIHRNGDIQIFPESGVELQLANNHENTETETKNEEKNFLVYVMKNNQKIFEVMLVTNEDKFSQEKEKIEIDRRKTKGGTLAFFSSAQTHVQLSALDASEKYTLPFSDVSRTSDYYESLQELFSRNLISGYTDGTFRPEAKISRAEFVQIALGVTSCLDCLAPSLYEKQKYYSVQSFPDILPESWFDFCISKAKKIGMITGYGDGFFRPENSITRAEAVAILIRQANIPQENFPKKAMIDVPSDAWFYPEMVTALNLGLVSEQYGYTFPNEEITRGEFARMASVLFSLRACTELDSDHDGIPDYIEEFNGMNAHDAADAKGVDINTLINPRIQKISDIPISYSSPDPNTENNANSSQSDQQNPVSENSDTQTREDDSVLPHAPEVYVSPDFEGDLCPTVPEDFDGILDDDGCPELFKEDPENSPHPSPSPSPSPSPFPSPSSSSSLPNPTETPNPTSVPIPTENPEISPPPGTTPDPKVVFYQEHITVIPGDQSICGFVDYRAQIRRGDTVWAAILRDDDSEIFSESAQYFVKEIWR